MVAAPVITIGVVLGLNYSAGPARRALATSDQEQWCFEQARADIAADLAGASSPVEARLVAAFSQTEAAYDDARVVAALVERMAAANASCVVARARGGRGGI